MAPWRPAPWRGVQWDLNHPKWLFLWCFNGLENGGLMVFFNGDLLGCFA